MVVVIMLENDTRKIQDASYPQGYNIPLLSSNSYINGISTAASKIEKTGLIYDGKIIQWFCLAALPVYLLGAAVYSFGFFYSSFRNDQKIYLLVGSLDCLVSAGLYIFAYRLASKSKRLKTRLTPKRNYEGQSFWIFCLTFLISIFYADWILGPIYLALGAWFGIGFTVLAVKGQKKRLPLIGMTIGLIIPKASLVAGELFQIYRPVFRNEPALLNTFELLIVTAGILTISVAVALPVQEYLTSLQRQSEELSKIPLLEAQAHELERQKIAIELHETVIRGLDILGNEVTMTVNSQQAQNISGLYEGLSVAQRLEELTAISRRLMVGLIPLQMRGDLVTAISNKLAEISSEHLIATRFVELLPGERNLISKILQNRETKIALYSIIVEILNNVIKHSQATEVEVELRVEEVFSTDTKGFSRIWSNLFRLLRLREESHQDNYFFSFTIKDDGIGMEPAQLNQLLLSEHPEQMLGKHQGLRSIEQQMHNLPFLNSNIDKNKVQLKFSTYPHKGFSVTGSLMLKVPSD